MTNVELTVLSQNIRSLNTGFPKLKQYLRSNDIVPEVICLQEIWKPKGTFNLRGYNNPWLIERRKGNGGGVGIWVKSSISFENLESDIIPEHLEYQIIKLKLGNTLLIVANVYRPPGGHRRHLLDFLDYTCNKYDKQEMALYIVGDMNINMASKDSNALTDKLIELEMEQKVNELTRIGKRKGTLIDHVYSNNKLTTKVDIEDTSVSDHCGIKITIKLSKQELNIQEVKHSYIYNDKTLTQVKLSLAQIDWTIFFEGLNCNKCAYKLESELNILIEKYCRKPIVKKAKITLSKETNKIRLKLRRLRKQMKSYQSSQIAEKYKKLKSEYETKLSKELNEYRNKLLNEKDPRKLWRNINELTDRPGKERSKIQIDNPQNQFATYFSEIAKVVESQIEKTNESPLKYSKVRKCNSLEFQTAKIEDLEAVFTSLKDKRSSGHDRLSSKALKSLAKELYFPIKIITDKMFNECKFPETWKLAKVIPLFKKGNKTELNNYRPISLLPAISKIGEKLIARQIYDFMETNSLFPDSQYGFRKNRGTNQAVSEVIIRMEDLKAKNKKFAIILMDFSKAFDVINHKILYKKLRRLHFEEKSIRLIKSYLTDRRMFVEIDGKKSDIIKMSNIGCPQGSVLGPLIYLLYTCSIGNLLSKIPHVLFADDTIVILPLPESRGEAKDKLEHFLKQCYSHFNAIKLKLNIQKTDIITNTESLNLTVHNNNISTKEKNETVRYLGVWLNANLNWSTHVDKVQSKMKNGLFALQKLKNNNCESKILLQVYDSLIMSYFNYCSSAWYTTSLAKDKERLFKIQKSAMRMIAGVPKRTRTNEICTKLHTLKLDDIDKLTTTGLIMTLLKAPKNNRLKNMTDTMTTRTRNNGKLTTRFRSKTLLKHITFANNHWEDITSGLTKKTVTKNLKTSIIQGYIEAIDQ